MIKKNLLLLGTILFTFQSQAQFWSTDAVDITLKGREQKLREQRQRISNGPGSDRYKRYYLDKINQELQDARHTHSRETRAIERENREIAKSRIGQPIDPWEKGYLTHDEQWAEAEKNQKAWDAERAKFIEEREIERKNEASTLKTRELVNNGEINRNPKVGQYHIPIQPETKEWPHFEWKTFKMTLAQKQALLDALEDAKTLNHFTEMASIENEFKTFQLANQGQPESITQVKDLVKLNKEVMKAAKILTSANKATTTADILAATEKVKSLVKTFIPQHDRYRKLFYAGNISFEGDQPKLYKTVRSGGWEPAKEYELTFDKKSGRIISGIQDGVKLSSRGLTKLLAGLGIASFALSSQASTLVETITPDETKEISNFQSRAFIRSTSAK